MILHHPIKGSIRKKLLFMMVLISFLVALIGYAGFSSWYIYTQYKNKISLAETVVNVLSQNIAKLILLDDIKEASDITTILQSYPDINYLVLFTKEGKIIYTYANKTSTIPSNLQLPKKESITTKHNTVTIIKNARYQEVVLGKIIINIKIKSTTAILLEDLPIFLLTLGFLFIISFLLASHYAKTFTLPIIKLIHFLETIKLEDLEKKQLLISCHSEDEFSILYDKINTMLDRIAKANKIQKIASATFEIDNAIMITDKNFHVLRVNKAYTKITHYSQEDVIGKLPPVFQHKLHSDSFYENIKETLKTNNQWHGEIKNRTKDGTVFYEELSIYPVWDNNQTIEYYIFSFSDITKQKDTEQKLRYLQQYDSLTGLPNKELALEQIKEKLNCQHALISFDIRHFKKINEAYGYETGDIILKEITHRIQKNFKNIVVFSRLENNRFLLYLEYTQKQQQEIPLEVNLDAEYLLSLFQKPFSLQEKTIYVTLSIGVTFCHKEKTPTILLNEAISALEYAKEHDLNIYFYDKKIQKKASKQIDIFSNLITALQNKEFVFYFQPQYTKDGKPYGAEVLIRWEHPKFGLIPPNEFIPLAEKTGLISNIGRYVIESACEELKLFQQYNHLQNFTLSINIGSKHFMEEDFISQVKEITSKYNINHHLLQFELTEYLLVDTPHQVAQTMHQLKQLGFKISLDDFGTGYSSLQYLRELPLDEIKIDKTFVDNCLKNKEDQAIISAIVVLAKALDIEIIAEGVEDENQLQQLQKLGCFHFQGYFFSKPLPQQELYKKLHINTPLKR